MILNQWYAILPSKAVKKEQVVGVKRLDLDLALFRNEKGELGCVVDQCTHRGAALSLGKVKGDCVQCPFHGLEFDTQGKCNVIPANGRASTQDLSRYNVRTYPVRENHDIIYIWYGEPEKTTDEVPFFYEDIDTSYVYSELEDHWNSHYSRCIENQLDVVHLPFVHHNTIGRGNKTLVNGPRVEIVEGGLITSANNEVDKGQTPLKASESPIKSTYLHFLYPNIWMNHISEKIKVVIFFAPVDQENTILYIRFYTKITRVQPVDRIIAFFGKYANKIIERQDKRVVITQRPKASAYRMNEKLFPGDDPVIQYQRMRDELKNK